MSQIQSIIVYRNPVEAAFYSGEWAEYLVPTGGAALAFLLTYIFVDRLSNAVIRKMGKNPFHLRQVVNTAALFSALTVSILTLQALWI